MTGYQRRLTGRCNQSDRLAKAAGVVQLCATALRGDDAAQREVLASSVTSSAAK
jgi:hypothetical protein